MFKTIFNVFINIKCEQNADKNRIRPKIIRYQKSGK